MSGPLLWLLFTAASVAFTWGIYGAATRLAEYRRPPRMVPVIVLAPGWPARRSLVAADWFAATITAAVAS